MLNLTAKSSFVTYIFLLSNMCVLGHRISFQDYCMSGKEPDAFPGHGDESSGTLVMSAEKTNNSWYEPNQNCTVIFKADYGFRILLTFSNISLRNSSMDNLTVSFNDNKEESVLAGQQVCTNENCVGLKFDSGDFGNLTLKFVSSNVSVPQNVTGFRAHYTVYDLVNPNNGACRRRDQFLCENGHCILGSLVCDGHNNCEDRSDETKCVIPVPDTVWGIVVIVIAIIAVIILVPLFCCLAIYGTRNVVKSVTLSNVGATPLLPTGDCGEAYGLLTSSEVASNVWPGTSCDRSNSFSYGTSQSAVPSTSHDVKRFRSLSEASEKLQDNKFL